jgi:tetraacyldisaccharide 4'-kinase
LVEYLLRALLPAGVRVAVVSRGYRRAGTGTHVVSDGRTLFGTALTGGDEPFQIARKFREAIVIVDERKHRAARAAVEEFGAQVVLVDDGFQHRALGRDLDIVVVDSTKALRDMSLLPAGRRRDLMGAMRRADAVVYSRCDDPGHGHEPFPEAAGVLRCCVRHALARCVGIRDGAERPLAELRGASAVAFCAIGDPASFRKSIEEAGCTLKGFYAYPDHHPLSLSALEEIRACVESAQADHLLTTEKDAVRISADPNLMGALPLQASYLEVAHEFVRGEGEFLNLLRSVALRSAA